MIDRKTVRPIPATHWALYCKDPVPLRFIDSGKESQIKWSFSHQVYCVNWHPDPNYSTQPLIEIKPQFWSTDLTAVAFDPKKMYFRNMRTSDETREIPSDIPEYDPKLRRVEERSNP